MIRLDPRAGRLLTPHARLALLAAALVAGGAAVLALLNAASRL